MSSSDLGRTEREQLEARALNLDARVFMMLSDGPQDPLLTLDLSMPQLKLLVLVERLGHPSMGDLAHMLGVGQSAVSGLVDRLSEHGLVRRDDDASDRRVVRVQASADGIEVVHRVRSAGRGRLQKVIGRLTDDELHYVVSAMEILHRSATQLVANQEAALRTPVESRG